MNIASTVRTEFFDRVAGPLGRSRVVVAMSGGVDSSTTAALMYALGHEVIGITLQLYDHGAASARKGACCAGQDIYDARRAADRIGIPHYVLDFEKRFASDVIDDFADSYLAGETPIPCVRCNQTVKFRDLLQTAKDLDADALVTGHYVRRVNGPDGAELHRATDRSKDQSYFLFATTSDQLRHLYFPLGGLNKDETRKLAGLFDLATADKPESQDICFVPNGNYAGVIEKLRPNAADPGDIVDLHGNVLGRHDGIIHYTVGQRRGLGLSAETGPHYVVRLEPDTRRVVVGPHNALLTREFAIREVNWLIDPPASDMEVTVKVRSTRDPVPASVKTLEEGIATVTLDKPEAGVAPGQACVMYQGERVIGGGWIIKGA